MVISTVAIRVSSPINNVDRFLFPHMLATICHFLCVFLMIVILTGVRWNLRVLLICIFLMLKLMNIFSCAYWLLSLLLFWKASIQFICPFFMGSIMAKNKKLTCPVNSRSLKKSLNLSELNLHHCQHGNNNTYS